MGLSTGRTKLSHQLPPQWIKLGAENAPAIVGNSINFSFNQLQNVVSNASKNGFRVDALGMAIVHNQSVDLPAGVAELRMFQINRDGHFNVNITQPNMDTKIMKSDTNLAMLGQAARIINPVFCALESTCPPKQGILQDTFAYGAFDRNYPINAAGAAFSSDRFSSINKVESWDDNKNVGAVGSIAIVSRSTVDVTMVPFAHYSGDNKYGSSATTDKIPFATLTNSNMPWQVRITNVVSAVSGFVAGTVITSDSFEIWVYLTFTKKSDRIFVGMLWTLQQTPIGGGDFNANPLLYRGIFSTPKYGVTGITDNGIAVTYVPENNHQFASKSVLRLFDDGTQCFPLESFSDYDRTVDHWNNGSLRGGNPTIRWDHRGVVASTIFKSPTSTIVAGSINNSLDAGILGLVSSMPWLPLAANHLFLAGFQVGFMSDPQNATSRLKISFDETLTAAQLAGVVSLHVNEFYDADMPKLFAYAIYGDSNQPVSTQLPTIIPCTDEMTSKSDLVRKIVPCMGNVSSR